MKEKQNTIVSGRFLSKTIQERLDIEDCIQYIKDYQNPVKPERTEILSGLKENLF
jgi:hypothetical protein